MGIEIQFVAGEDGLDPTDAVDDVRAKAPRGERLRVRAPVELTGWKTLEERSSRLCLSVELAGELFSRHSRAPSVASSTS